MMRPLLLGFVLVLAACGGSDEADPTTTSLGDRDLSTTTTTAAPVTGTALPGSEPLFGSFDQRIAGTTPESGGGPHPLLEWTEVSGADHYAVYVYAPSGEPYWVWMGDSASVHVGGEPQLEEGALGPAVTQGMSWIVIAYDESQVPIAVSPERPISP